MSEPQLKEPMADAPAPLKPTPPLTLATAGRALRRGRRNRLKRELITVAGIAAVLGLLVFANTQMTRLGLVEKYDKMRRMTEQQQIAQGVKMLSWDLMRKTKGNLRKGPTFPDELKEYHGRTVTLAGFIFPIEQFRQMTSFMLLPLPIQCYFCQLPPVHDVMLVQMAEGETAEFLENVVIFSGELVLFEEPGSKFFFAVKNARRGVQEGTRDTKRELDPQHLLHTTQGAEQEELLEGIEPPKAE